MNPVVFMEPPQFLPGSQPVNLLLIFKKVQIHTKNYFPNFNQAKEEGSS